MSRILTAAIFALTLSAPALADSIPAGATLWRDRPTGAGKPDAISCYKAATIETHIVKLHCARNWDWAQVRQLEGATGFNNPVTSGPGYTGLR